MEGEEGLLQGFIAPPPPTLSPLPNMMVYNLNQKRRRGCRNHRRGELIYVGEFRTTFWGGGCAPFNNSFVQVENWRERREGRRTEAGIEKIGSEKKAYTWFYMF